MQGELFAINPVLHVTGLLANLVTNDLIEQVKLTQVDDQELTKFMEKSVGIKVDNLGVARFRGRLCVPKDENLWKMILQEAHRSKFSIHPRMTKMYQDMKRTYWWICRKGDVADFVSK